MRSPLFALLFYQQNERISPSFFGFASSFFGLRHSNSFSADTIISWRRVLYRLPLQPKPANLQRGFAQEQQALDMSVHIRGFSPLTPMKKERSKAMANRTRKNKLTLYLSDDEKYILENKTRLSGLNSQSAYLRNLIIYGYVYEVDYRYLHDYSVELSRIGGLLNQITKRANTTGNLYPEDIREIKEIMEKIWHTHASMLSKQPLTAR